MDIKPISALETFAVRHPVLRTGKPLESCAFEGDDLETTFHLGCFDGDQLVGVATFMANDHPEYNFGNAGQLRGMAVLTTYQGKGIGRKLLTFGESLLQKQHKATVWMNAREIAVPFYAKLNYAIIGHVFDVPGIGPHFVMHKQLS